MVTNSIKHELSLWIHNHSLEPVFTATVQRMELKDIAIKFADLLAKSPYRIYQDCQQEYLIFKK